MLLAMNRRLRRTEGVARDRFCRSPSSSVRTSPKPRTRRNAARRAGAPATPPSPARACGPAVPSGARRARGNATTPPAAQAEQPAPQADRFSNEELRKLLAPIALYPDALLAQMLPAAAYPLEIVQAERWLEKNPALVAKNDFSGIDSQKMGPSGQGDGALSRRPPQDEPGPSLDDRSRRRDRQPAAGCRATYPGIARGSGESGRAQVERPADGQARRVERAPSGGRRRRWRRQSSRLRARATSSPSSRPTPRCSTFPPMILTPCGAGLPSSRRCSPSGRASRSARWRPAPGGTGEAARSTRVGRRLWRLCGLARRGDQQRQHQRRQQRQYRQWQSASGVRTAIIVPGKAASRESAIGRAAPADRAASGAGRRRRQAGRNWRTRWDWRARRRRRSRPAWSELAGWRPGGVGGAGRPGGSAGLADPAASAALAGPAASAGLAGPAGSAEPAGPAASAGPAIVQGRAIVRAPGLAVLAARAPPIVRPTGQAADMAVGPGVTAALAAPGRAASGARVCAEADLTAGDAAASTAADAVDIRRRPSRGRPGRRGRAAAIRPPAQARYRPARAPR